MKALDPRAVFNHRILRYNHNAISNIVIIAFEIFNPTQIAKSN